MNKSLEIFNRAVKESKGTNLIELANSEIQVIKESLERLEKLEKVVNDFLEYLRKEPNRTILKHSIKQTFNKLLKEELKKNENIQ